MFHSKEWISSSSNPPTNKNWVLGKFENGRRQIVSYHPTYKHWVNEDGNKIKGIMFWVEMPR